MKYIRLGLLMSLALIMAACSSSSLSGHDLDYTSEKMISPLVVPPGMNNPVKEAYYTAPSYSETRHQAQLSLLPPGSNLKRFDKKPSKQSKGH